VNVQNVLPRDAIPSLDHPTFGPEYFGAADDEVLVIDGDPPRAYPIRILSYHEIVNDVVDGRPIAVTWCPICWSAAIYDGRVDGQTLTFGTSGKLADDVLVMYDRETESEWQQSTGTAIAGQLDGERLSLLQSPTLTWEQFSKKILTVWFSSHRVGPTSPVVGTCEIATTWNRMNATGTVTSSACTECVGKGLDVPGSARIFPQKKSSLAWNTAVSQPPSPLPGLKHRKASLRPVWATRTSS